jgi:hypothetical protein
MYFGENEKLSLTIPFRFYCSKYNEDQMGQICELNQLYLPFQHQTNIKTFQTINHFCYTKLITLFTLMENQTGLQ